MTRAGCRHLGLLGHTGAGADGLAGPRASCCPAGVDPENAETYFKKRLVFGIIVGSACMAGALLFLVRLGFYTHSLAVLLCVATMTLATLAYAVVPAHYIGLGLPGMPPSGVRYFSLGLETGSSQFLVLGVICFALTAFVLRKALTNSRWTTQAIEANMRLSDEMHERQRAEAALRESETSARQLAGMLRMMCDNVPDMIWAKDLEGRYRFANKAVCEQLLERWKPMNRWARMISFCAA